MSDIDLPESDDGSRLELRALFSYAWEGRRIIFISVCVFIVLGFVWYRFTPRVYEASAVLSAAPSSLQSTGSGGGALSSAARLIGISGGGPNNEYTKFQALLNSSALAKRLADDGMLQKMFPSRWDTAAHSWKPHTGIVYAAKDALRRILGLAPRRDPNWENVLSYLEQHVSQDLSLQTSLLTLKVTGPSPQFAKDLLIAVHRQADDILRKAARTRSELRIKYLERTLPGITAVDQREALIQLLNQEEQTRMMTQSDPNFAADMVDPPHASPAPVSPLFIASMFTSVMLGIVIGFLVYVVLRALGLHDFEIRWRPHRLVEAWSSLRR